MRWYFFNNLLRKQSNMYDVVLAAMLGHAVADALGVPVEFMDRQELKRSPVTDFQGYGTYPVPAGTWSDDTSMNLATLDSLSSGLDYSDMMHKFCRWQMNAEYTATDSVFDIGITTSNALGNFRSGISATSCGQANEYSNGNGSLMRIIPAILFCKYKWQGGTISDHIEMIHNISALTHAHQRSQIGCGIYYFILMELLENPSKLSIHLGLNKAKAYYCNHKELSHYHRLFEKDFSKLPEYEIDSSGYVVATLEAALWALLRTSSYRECVLTAVNLGYDTDTVAAVAGGLAGVMYGLKAISVKWIRSLIRSDSIKELCGRFCDAPIFYPKPIVFDIHSHILFDIDDGAQSIEESIALLQMAYAQGIRRLICTSHSGGDMDQYERNLDLLSDRVFSEGIPIELYPGCEICCTKSTVDQKIAGILTGRYPSLAGSAYILLEVPPYSPPDELLACVDAILSRTSQKVVLAHAERCFCLRDDFSTLRALEERGCLLQINAYSLESESNSAIKTFARYLLEAKKVSFIGSDAHSIEHRPPAIEAGINFIYSHCEKEYADRICFRNADELILQPK